MKYTVLGYGYPRKRGETEVRESSTLRLRRTFDSLARAKRFVTWEVTRDYTVGVVRLRFIPDHLETLPDLGGWGFEGYDHSVVEAVIEADTSELRTQLARVLNDVVHSRVREVRGAYEA